MKIAVRETIDFITKYFPHPTREEAYMDRERGLDYHVTQVVEALIEVDPLMPPRRQA
jgi:hypothetical protein